jgi:hypothetical protein
MAPTAAQFSPGQILEAGRRAENDGRVGYAIQFYRHLTDNHNWSPEAAVAKEALTRLANFRPAGDAPTSGGLAQQPPAPQQQSWPGNVQGGPGNGHGAPAPGSANGARPASPPNGTAPIAYPQVQAPMRAPAVNGHGSMHVGTADRSEHALLRLPAPQRRYRIGSVVAWLLFGIGLAMMAVGLALAGLQLVGFKVPGSLGTMLGFTGGLPGAMAIFTVGVTQVFAAQLGRALFDTANAASDLAMIERAKIAHAAGDRPFSDDDEPA